MTRGPTVPGFNLPFSSAGQVIAVKLQAPLKSLCHVGDEKAVKPKIWTWALGPVGTGDSVPET